MNKTREGLEERIALLEEENASLLRDFHQVEKERDTLEDKLAHLEDWCENFKAKVRARQKSDEWARPLADALYAFAEWQSGGYGGEAWKENARAEVSQELWSDVSDCVYSITGDRPPFPSALRDER